MKPPHIKSRFIGDQVRALLHLPNDEIAAKLNCHPKYVQQCRRSRTTPVRPSRPGDWSDERVAEVKRLWADGLSASQIAGRLGGVTRNSVISKVHRLGLATRSTHARVRTKPRKVAPPPKPISPAAQVLKAIKRDGLPLPTPAETDVARVSHEDLLDHHCRWPCWSEAAPNADAPAFCGKKKIPGLVYCEVHARRAFQPPQSRRREQPVLQRELVE